MNIFFTAAISGGRAHQPEYAQLVHMLENYGTVYSRHIKDEGLSQYGETAEKPSNILAREKDALEQCEIIVAEVTTPSLGVGYLLASASSMNKKILALFQADDTMKLSAIIKGDPRIQVRTYQTSADIQRIFAEMLI